MNELFNLVGQIKEVYEMMTDPDIDEQVVNDTLEGLMGELSVHAAGIVQLRDRLDMEMEACKKQKDEWAVAEKIRKNRKAQLDELVKITMTQLGVDEIEAGDVLLTLKNAGGKLPLIVDGTVPEKYTKITIENDNELIRKALDAGEELDFAHYGPRSKTIRVKK
jgi:oligoendopeptidase F